MIAARSKFIGKYLKTLLGASSAALNSDKSIIEIESGQRPPKIEAELAALLSARNGFQAFLSALHVLPAQSTADAYGLADWNSESLWKSAYGKSADDLLCFAEDVFGNQFAIRMDHIVVFKCETGDSSFFASSLEEWAEKLLTDFDCVTGYTFARDWQMANGSLRVGTRLCPIVPFVIGGAYSVGNMRAVEDVRMLRGLGDFARQIHGKPDGTRIQLKICPRDVL